MYENLNIPIQDGATMPEKSGTWIGDQNRM